MKLNLTVDEVLTTTRNVRKRLDTSKPVSREVIDECIDLALQAPNGDNHNSWHWIVVDDPGLIRKLGEIYKRSIYEVANGKDEHHKIVQSDVDGAERIIPSAIHLAEAMADMPALLVPMAYGRSAGEHTFIQGNMWGSILQAVWSFFLALRERGMGSAWTTLTLRHEKEVADLLGIPFDQYTQAGLFPIAHTIGTDFRRAPRKPLGQVRSFNRFQI